MFCTQQRPWCGQSGAEGPKVDHDVFLEKHGHGEYFSTDFQWKTTWWFLLEERYATLKGSLGQLCGKQMEEVGAETKERNSCYNNQSEVILAWRKETAVEGMRSG